MVYLFVNISVVIGVSEILFSDFVTNYFLSRTSFRLLERYRVAKFLCTGFGGRFDVIGCFGVLYCTGERFDFGM